MTWSGMFGVRYETAGHDRLEAAAVCSYISAKNGQANDLEFGETDFTSNVRTQAKNMRSLLCLLEIDLYHCILCNYSYYVTCMPYT